MKTFVGYLFILLLCFTCPNVNGQKGAVNGPPPPEVVIEDVPEEKPSRIEYVSNAPVEVLTNPENIGDIEMEVEVHEVKPDKIGAPELVVKNQVNEDIVLQASGVNGADPENMTTDASGAVNGSESASPESGSSESPIITDAPTDDGGTEGSTKEATIWPIILLSLLFIFLAIFGICWAVTAFCAAVNEPLVIETAEFQGGSGGAAGEANDGAASGANDGAASGASDGAASGASDGAAGGANDGVTSEANDGAAGRTNDDPACGTAVENDVPPSNRPPSNEGAEN